MLYIAVGFLFMWALFNHWVCLHNCRTQLLALCIRVICMSSYVIIGFVYISAVHNYWVCIQVYFVIIGVAGFKYRYRRKLLYLLI